MDQSSVKGLQGFAVKAQAIQNPRTVKFQQHVGELNQGFKSLLAIFGLQVDGNHRLAGVDGVVIGRLNLIRAPSFSGKHSSGGWVKAAHWVAGGRFHLKDRGPHIAKHLVRKGLRKKLAEVDDANTGQKFPNHALYPAWHLVTG
jgi:hypothetical protein